MFCFRLLWAVIVLIATAVLLYVVVYNVQRLMSYPKNIDINIEYRDSMPFPAVTICNLNQYRCARA